MVVPLRRQQRALLGDSERDGIERDARDRGGASHEGRRSVRWVETWKRSNLEGNSGVRRRVC